MKNKKFYRIIIIVAMIAASITMRSEESSGWDARTMKKLFFGSVLTYMVTGMSRDLIREIAVYYVDKYDNLIKNKIFSEQLRTLQQSKNAINRYTSPLEVKVLDDIIWLSEAVVERCSVLTKGKSPVEQVAVLKDYLKSFSWGQGRKDYKSISLLSKNGWFARNFYKVDRFGFDHGRLMGATVLADEEIEKSLIDGFIQEIIKKNNLRTRYTAADVKRYQAGVPLHMLLDVKYP